MLTLTIVIQNGLQLIADEFTREPKLQARANLDTHYLGTKICESELPSDMVCIVMHLTNVFWIFCHKSKI